MRSRVRFSLPLLAVLLMQLLLPVASWAHEKIEHPTHATAIDDHHDHDAPRDDGRHPIKDASHCEICISLQNLRASGDLSPNIGSLAPPVATGSILPAAADSIVVAPYLIAAWPRGPPVSTR